MVVCDQCGSEVEEGNFCPDCGAPVDPSAVMPTVEGQRLKIRPTARRRVKKIPTRAKKRLVRVPTTALPRTEEEADDTSDVLQRMADEEVGFDPLAYTPAPIHHRRKEVSERAYPVFETPPKWMDEAMVKFVRGQSMIREQYDNVSPGRPYTFAELTLVEIEGWLPPEEDDVRSFHEISVMGKDQATIEFAKWLRQADFSVPKRAEQDGIAVAEVQRFMLKQLDTPKLLNTFSGGLHRARDVNIGEDEGSVLDRAEASVNITNYFRIISEEVNFHGERYAARLLDFLQMVLKHPKMNYQLLLGFHREKFATKADRMVPCPSCHFNRGASWPICPHCGFTLKPTRTCSFCRGEAAEGDVNCNWCGAQLPETEVDYLTQLKQSRRLEALGQFLELFAEDLRQGEFSLEVAGEKLKCSVGEVNKLIQEKMALQSVVDPLRAACGLETSEGRRPWPPALADPVRREFEPVMTAVGLLALLAHRQDSSANIGTLGRHVHFLDKISAAIEKQYLELVAFIRRVPRDQLDPLEFEPVGEVWDPLALVYQDMLGAPVELPIVTTGLVAQVENSVDRSIGLVRLLPGDLEKMALIAEALDLRPHVSSFIAEALVVAEKREVPCVLTDSLALKVDDPQRVFPVSQAVLLSGKEIACDYRTALELELSGVVPGGLASFSRVYLGEESRDRFVGLFQSGRVRLAYIREDDQDLVDVMGSDLDWPAPAVEAAYLARKYSGVLVTSRPADRLGILVDPIEPPKVDAFENPHVASVEAMLDQQIYLGLTSGRWFMLSGSVVSNIEALPRRSNVVVDEFSQAEMMRAGDLALEFGIPLEVAESVLLSEREGLPYLVEDRMGERIVCENAILLSEVLKYPKKEVIVDVQSSLRLEMAELLEQFRILHMTPTSQERLEKFAAEQGVEVVAFGFEEEDLLKHLHTDWGLPVDVSSALVMGKLTGKPVRLSSPINAELEKDLGVRVELFQTPEMKELHVGAMARTMQQLSLEVPVVEVAVAQRAQVPEATQEGSIVTDWEAFVEMERTSLVFTYQTVAMAPSSYSRLWSIFDRENIEVRSLSTAEQRQAIAFEHQLDVPLNVAESMILALRLKRVYVTSEEIVDIYEGDLAEDPENIEARRYPEVVIDLSSLIALAELGTIDKFHRFYITDSTWERIIRLRSTVATIDPKDVPEWDATVSDLANEFGIEDDLAETVMLSQLLRPESIISLELEAGSLQGIPVLSLSLECVIDPGYLLTLEMTEVKELTESYNVHIVEMGELDQRAMQMAKALGLQIHELEEKELRIATYMAETFGITHGGARSIVLGNRLNVRYHLTDEEYE